MTHPATRLIALKNGLPPHAVPLDCADMRGHASLFGEAASVPRPIKNWSVNPQNAQSIPPARNDSYAESLVLWEEVASDASFEDEQLRIAKQIVDSKDERSLSVPATTFIAGESASTFSLAWDIADDGELPDWGAIICSCQTEGRGQLRRAWHSPRGNLYVTFRLPDDPVFQDAGAALIVGYLFCTALKNMGFPVSIKWPNDLLIHEQQKIGGILLEERNGVLLAGMGINLLEAPLDECLRKEKAVSAGVLLPEYSTAMPQSCCLTKREQVAPFYLWRLLVSEAILAYSRSVKGRPARDVYPEIAGHLAWRNKNIVLTDGDELAVTGRYLGVGPHGGIILQSEKSSEKEHFSGSLSLVK